MSPNIFLVAALTIVLCAHSSLAESCEVEFGQMLIARLPAHHLVGGIVLYRNNFSYSKSRARVANYIQSIQRQHRIPLFVATDHEGGLVQRLRPSSGFTKIPRASELGERATTNEIRRLGQIAGEELRGVGINMNLAPVADLAWEQNEIINRSGRSYSASADRVTECVEANAREMVEASVIPTLKHFPGHGLTKGDSHQGQVILDRTKQEIWENEILPYQRVADRRLPAIFLVGHINLPRVGLKDPNTPSSLNEEIIMGWIRKQIGFRGLIMTDDLAMGAITKYYSLFDAAVKATLAGANLLSLGRDVTATQQAELIQAVCSVAAHNRLLRKKIWTNYKAILKYKRDFGIVRMENLKG